MNKAQFGMVGLGTMGRNFLLNAAEHGFSCTGYDLDAGKRGLLLEEGKDFDIRTAENLAEFCAGLERPRRIMLLVPAGKIVDSVIAELLPFLDTGDILIDGGNSHFADTERREAFLSERGIEFLGVGVSGGEAGARHGASIMPGGRREVYAQVAALFEAVSAKVGGEPCVAFMGRGSAGHFVKMVHNGIEYGLMQILAETYDFMSRVLGMNYAEMSRTFAVWNNSELNSFLVEITAEVLRKVDAETGRPLVEMILDKAGQKGTGKWTSQAAMDFGVPVPTIDAAVSMRQISAQKEVRLRIAEKYAAPTLVQGAQPETGDRGLQSVSSEPVFEMKAEIERRAAETVASEQMKTTAAGQAENFGGENSREPLGNSSDENRSDELRREFREDAGAFVEKLKNALFGSFVVAYAQGMSLLQTASIEKGYELDLAEIARIWRGGCIIRSALLEEMRRAYAENPDLPNLMLDDRFAEALNGRRADWRSVNEKFTESCVPALCLAASLAYFDAFRSARLPANLIQAQRDFFGAHTYQRIDKEGIFHTPDWKG